MTVSLDRLVESVEAEIIAAARRLRTPVNLAAWHKARRENAGGGSVCCIPPSGEPGNMVCGVDVTLCTPLELDDNGRLMAVWQMLYDYTSDVNCISGLESIACSCEYDDDANRRIETFRASYRIADLR